MFSSTTRRHIANGFLAVLFLGMCVFAPVVLWPVMQRNAADVATLLQGETKLDEWVPAQGNAAPAKLPVQGRIEAAKLRLSDFQEVYRRLADFYAPRDRALILDRASLLRALPDHPYRLKEDYDRLMEELNKIAARHGRDPDARLLVEPIYRWAGPEGDGNPKKEDYVAIVKRACLTGALVRLLSGPQGRCGVLSISYEEDPPEVKGAPPKSNVKDFGAVRCRISRAKVVFEVRFSLLRSALERVLTAPTHTVEAPTIVHSGDRGTYRLPFIKIRSLSFAPVYNDWARVSAVLDVYDFVRPEQGDAAG